MRGISAGTASAAVMGTFLCAALTMAAVAGMVVISLISVYTPNHSEEVWGEEYTFDSAMLKLLYGNVNYGFTNGTVAYSSSFSDYCTSQFTNTDLGNVQGCVVANGEGWGPYNTSSSSRRRRRADSVGLYAVYKIRVFFSSKCAKNSDKNKYQNSSSVSSCVLQRLKYCNNLANYDTTTTRFKTWTSTPSFSLSIVDNSNTPAYRTITPTTVYGVSRTIASSIANSFGMGSTIKTGLSGGCRYVGGLSKTSIATIIAAYATQTTTSPPTVNSG